LKLYTKVIEKEYTESKRNWKLICTQLRRCPTESFPTPLGRRMGSSKFAAAKTEIFFETVDSKS